MKPLQLRVGGVRWGIAPVVPVPVSAREKVYHLVTIRETLNVGRNRDEQWPPSLGDLTNQRTATPTRIATCSVVARSVT